MTANHREEITEKIIKALKEGTAPWQKEWSQDCVPVNAVTGKTYNCVNSIILSIAGNEMSSDGDMRWATRNQAASRGWVIKSGEKAIRIDIYPMIDKKDKFGHLVKMSSGEIAQTRIKRTIELYHASQMIGIPRSKGFKRKTIINNEVIERIIYNSSARIFERGKEAYYSPRDDLIIMPPKTAFTGIESYYSTLLHELAVLDRPRKKAEEILFMEQGHERRLCARRASSGNSVNVFVSGNGIATNRKALCESRLICGNMD